MENEIEEMKCPYCSNGKNLFYGDLIESDYDDGIYRADWDIVCPVCKKTFIYTEVYELKRAYNNI